MEQGRQRIYGQHGEAQRYRDEFVGMGSRIGAVLSFSQLQEEVSMKGSILYLIMACCRPIEKAADDEEGTPCEGREEEGDRDEVKQSAANNK